MSHEVTIESHDGNNKKWSFESSRHYTVTAYEENSTKKHVAGPYDPFEHRKVENATTDLETLIHLLKGSLGSGVLAMPYAFKSAGVWFGLGATFFVGFVCTYCIHVLVRCSHILCKRVQVPTLTYPKMAEVAFDTGPYSIRKFAKWARGMVDLFLVADLIGACCVYVELIASNLKDVCDKHWKELDPRIYMIILLPPLLLMNLIRSLKFLAPFSLIANVLMACGLGISLYYIGDTIAHGAPPHLDVAPLSAWPSFFGVAVFALEGVGVVMSLENNMKTPGHFIGCPSVLNIGMGTVVALYAIMGFTGYWAYGADTKDTVTANLPNDWLGQSVKIMIALAIFFTYSLQFYVPMEVIWRLIKHRFVSHPVVGELGLRVFFVTFTVVVAILVPDLGPFITLVGAVCLSTLGIIFPATVEMITTWEHPGFGRGYYRLIKNILIILFGIVGFATGTYVSINDIRKSYQNDSI